MKKKGIFGLCLALMLALLTACGGGYETGDERYSGAGGYGETGQQIQSGDLTGEGSEQALSEEDSRRTRDRGEETPLPEGSSPGEDETSARPETSADLPDYGESYYDLVSVVLYLELYEELPPNYITKEEARGLGWEGGTVEDYREGAAIGGDTFGNREGLLPQAKGRTYTECDIDTKGYGSRGSRRLVFSSDGLYFYTSDHYESFSEVTVTEDYEVIW